MNKSKLIARTARIEILRDRHNPPYIIVNADNIRVATATKRDEARERKNDLVQGPITAPQAKLPLHIEKRQIDANGNVSYAKIR